MVAFFLHQAAQIDKTPGWVSMLTKFSVKVSRTLWLGVEKTRIMRKIEKGNMLRLAVEVSFENFNI